MSYINMNGDEETKDDFHRPELAIKKEEKPEETAIEILKELCQLKHYKDAVGKDDFYEKKQPELWKKANDFLNSLIINP